MVKVTGFIYNARCYIRDHCIRLLLDAKHISVATTDNAVVTYINLNAVVVHLNNALIMLCLKKHMVLHINFLHSSFLQEPTE